MKNWQKLIPALDWIPQYNRQQLRGDLLAGVTVGVMLIPQGMAYAMLAGMPPIYGLYASLIPLVIYALLGTSRQLAVGPVAMVALLISSGVGQLAAISSDEYIALTLLLTLMVGAIQALLGIFRLGLLVNFLSHPVISGFTSAAALIIGFSQLKHLLGIPIPRSHHIHTILFQAVGKWDQVHWPTLLLGAVAIVLILVLKRVHKLIPGPLVAVVLGTVAVVVAGLDQSGMQIVGTVPEGLPGYSAPLSGFNRWQELFPIALTIALVGFMESIAVAKAIQARHKNYQIDSNKELIGLGMANVIGSFFQSFPVTGGFSRTAVNDQAGAQTGMASILSAILIAVTLLFLTPLFYYLPKAVLAAIIMVAVFGLVDWKEAVHLWKTDKKDGLLLLLTFLATLSLGIEAGIGVGVLASVLMTLYKSAYPHIAILGQLPDSDHFRNIKRYPQAKELANIRIIRFDAQLFYANAGIFKERILQSIAQRSERNVETVILDASGINALDSTGVHMLRDLHEDMRNRSLRLVFAGVKGPVRDALQRNGLIPELGPAHFYFSVSDAVAAIRGDHFPEEYRRSVLQHNVNDQGL